MIEEIKKELSRTENESEIKILLAVESGSRAWGFASVLKKSKDIYKISSLKSSK